MKLVMITYRFEFAERIEAILDAHEIGNFVRLPMVEGADADGKHYGTQVFPGNESLVQAQVSDDALDGLLEDLRAFRDEKPAHAHVTAAVLDVARGLDD